MNNIEISKINIDETQLLIKDAQNRQDLNSLSTKVQSISTNLSGVYDNINFEYLGMFFSKTLASGPNINISQSTDLNTPTMTKTGRYSCPTNAIAETLSNSPVKSAFMMLTYNLTSEEADEMPDGQWTSRTRILMTYNGSIFISAITRSNEGVYSYGDWYLVTTDYSNFAKYLFQHNLQTNTKYILGFSTYSNLGYISKQDFLNTFYSSGTDSFSPNTTSISTGTINVDKNGHLVNIYTGNLRLRKKLDSSAIEIGTLADVYKPDTVRFILGSNASNNIFKITINTNGKITIASINGEVSANVAIGFNITYYTPK